MYLIAGLGNPGRKYQYTRHNLGFRVIEALAQNHQIPLNKKKFQSIFGQGIIEGHKVHLILPQTYMNLSGVAVGHWVRYFQSNPERLMVVHDDLDLAWGRLRIVAKGGAGGPFPDRTPANQRFYPAASGRRTPARGSAAGSVRIGNNPGEPTRRLGLICGGGRIGGENDTSGRR